MKDATHIMLDMETLGTSPGSAVLAVAACAFRIGCVPTHSEANQFLGRPQEHEAYDPLDSGFFYRNVSIQSCINMGLRIDGATVEWWFKQSEEARASVLDDPRHVSDVVNELNRWIKEIRRQENARSEGSNPILIWSHGATFDIPIYGELCRVSMNKPAFYYGDARDTRTLFALAPGVVREWSESGKRNPMPHMALHDAVYQARMVDHVFRALNQMS